MADVQMVLTKKVLKDGPRAEVIRDDAGMILALIDATDYGKKYRGMRRSADRLADDLAAVCRSQAEGQDATAFVMVSAEQLEHLYEIAKDPPTEGQHATIRCIGGPMRKALILIEDTHDDWKKEKDGKAEGKAEQRDDAARPVVAEV